MTILNRFFGHQVKLSGFVTFPAIIGLTSLLKPLRLLLFISGLGGIKIRHKPLRILYVFYQVCVFALVWLLYATRLYSYVNANGFHFEEFRSDKATLIAALLWIVQEAGSVVVSLYVSITDKHESLPFLWEAATGDNLVSSRAWIPMFLTALSLIMTSIGTALEIVFPYPIGLADPLSLIDVYVHGTLGTILNCILSVMFNIWWWVPLGIIAVVAGAVSCALAGFRDQITQGEDIFSRPSRLIFILSQHSNILALVDWLESSFSCLVAVTVATAIPTCIMLLYSLFAFDNKVQFTDYGLDLYHVLENLTMLLCVFVSSQIVAEHERLYLALYGRLVAQLSKRTDGSLGVYAIYEERWHSRRLGANANDIRLPDSERECLLILGNSFQLLSKAPVGVTAFGFFTMRRETLLNIFAAIVTYLVVLIQVSGQRTYGTMQTDNVNATIIEN